MRIAFVGFRRRDRNGRRPWKVATGYAKSRNTGAMFDLTVLLAVILALSVSTALRAGETKENTSDAEVLASRMVTQLLAVPWRQDIDGFRKANPGANVTSFHGDGSVLFFRQYWACRCSVSHPGFRSQETFYLPPSLEKEKPILLMVQMAGAGGPQAAPPSEKLWRALRDRLTAALGPPAPWDLSYFGNVDWSDQVSWRTPEIRVVLYRTEGVTRLIAEHASIAAMAKQFKDAVYDAPKQLDAETKTARLARVKSELARAGLAEILARVTPAIVLSNDDAQTRLALALRLARLARGGVKAQPGVAPALLYAVDLLLPDEMPLPAGGKSMPPPEWKALEALGFKYYASPLSGTLNNAHSALEELMDRYGASPWAKYALADEARGGFDLGSNCEGGSDQYAIVIARVTPLLQSVKDPLVGGALTFDLGRAYETWWSLGQCENDPYADAGDYQTQKGYAQSRKEALALYQVILKEDPDGPRADILKFVVPRLILGVDTNCRDYYCIYD